MPTQANRALLTNRNLEGWASSRPAIPERHREHPSSAYGFTLIELLIVVTIIAVLVSIALPVYNGIQERARATQDMSNLRQIGLATQMYMNDNDSVIFSTSDTWMNQLHPKYLPAWKIFQSPFDKRTASEVGNSSTPISYGLNGKTTNGNTSIAGYSSDKIYNPSALIIFAPALDKGGTITFNSGANPTAAVPGVTEYAGTSSPGGAATGGTHTNRTRIDAAFGDWHIEALTWTQFINTSSTASDPNGTFRWDPTATPTPSP